MSTPVLPFGEALARYSVPWLQLDWPLDWSRAFGRRAPLALEIGYGNGAFLLAQAQRHPERDWIGIERSWGSTQRALRKLCARPLENVRLLEGDAAFLLSRLFAPESLERIELNFPDPWPKARHHARRLIQPAFVRLLAQRLASRGELRIATDHPDYAHWIAEVLQGQAGLAPSGVTPWVSALPGRIPTKYERKALERGARIHYFVWHRAGPVAGSPAAKERLEPMPNVVLKGPIPLERALDALSPQVWQEEHQGQAVVIKLLARYRPVGGGHGLVEVMVKEGPLTQHLAIAVYPEGEEKLLIKPAALGYPRPTWGVKRAVWHLARTLLERCPPLREASSTVGRLKG